MVSALSCKWSTAVERSLRDESLGCCVLVGKLTSLERNMAKSKVQDQHQPGSLVWLLLCSLNMVVNESPNQVIW
jgi:hypothetical protein